MIRVPMYHAKHDCTILLLRCKGFHVPFKLCMQSGFSCILYCMYVVRAFMYHSSHVYHECFDVHLVSCMR